MFIAKTTVKPNLKSLDNTLHSRNHITKGCKDGEFQCESDGVCIVGYKVCNNYNDCSDQSDEKDCEFDTGDYIGKALFVLLAHHPYKYLYFNYLMFGLFFKKLVLAQSKLLKIVKWQNLS